MTKILEDLLYTEDDEWVRVDGDQATVGITDYAQDSLSDIVFLELPEPGEQFEAGDAFGVVESVKAAADLYMPLSGQITEVNEDLLDAPEIINNDPYGAAWMIKMEISDKSEFDNLMDADAYRKHVAARE